MGKIAQNALGKAAHDWSNTLSENGTCHNEEDEMSAETLVPTKVKRAVPLTRLTVRSVAFIKLQAQRVLSLKRFASHRIALPEIFPGKWYM